MEAKARLDITQLLLAWGNGDAEALDRLTPLVYSEIHRLAENYLRRESRNHSLQATELVNEAYLRLVDTSQVRWQNRAHFFAMAGRIMRRVLVDLARGRNNQKRGGGWRQVTLDDALAVSAGPGVDLEVLDEALDGLARFDRRKAEVVELRFFGGLSLRETAEALKISEDTVGRDWDAAKAWLLRELKHR